MTHILNSQTPSLEALRERLEAIPDRNKVGFGWLRFSCQVSYRDYWRTRIKTYFRSELLSRGKGWNGYLESDQGMYGILVAHTPVLTEAERLVRGVKRSPNEGHMTVDIPQTAMDSLSSSNLFEFLLDVYACEGMKFRRVDSYYDDYCKIISPEQVHMACKRGGVGVPRYQRIRGWDESNLQTGNSQGYTVYFGAPKSEKQLRFYDKRAESDGRQDCYRWEVEHKGKEAEAYQEWLCEVLSEAVGCPTLEQSVQRLTDALKQVIKGAISFHEIPEGLSPQDMPQNWAARTPIVWWWKELLAGLEPAKLVVERIQPSLAATVAWIRHQVVPGLALLRTAYSHWKIPFKVWLDRELEQGEERWKDRHWKLLAEALVTSPAY